MRQQLHLLVIDPQNDFCDLPPDYLPRHGAGPALPVPGAHADMLRVAGLITEGGAGLSGITVTLDAHHRIDIAHPAFWQRGDGTPVDPFTQIDSAMVRSGALLPREAGATARVLAYLDSLEQNGRYQLMVWPTHCEIGSWGQNVHAAVRAAYNGWEERGLATVHKVLKGSNRWTEHYSAIEAEVPDPDDPATLANMALVAALAQADKVYITGEAASHCVRATTLDLVRHWDPARLDRLVLVTDCMSPVTGFDGAYRAFARDMLERGLTLAPSRAVLAELLANGAPA